MCQIVKENEGVWLRGNLHMHTHKSDGRLSFEDALAVYENAGYDFVAVTDHWVLSEKGQTPGGMLLLAGCEYDVGNDVVQGLYHIVGIDMKNKPKLAKCGGLGPQEVIDEINRSGGLAILAHPAWSLNSADIVSKMHGIFGTEIYNSTSSYMCNPSNARPYSGLFVDQMAARGVMLSCVAVDDTHKYYTDSLKSYIMVHAREKTNEAVVNAIRNGDFYATQGPSVSVNVEGRTVKVKCSPASYVLFYSNAPWNRQRVTSGESITEARCELMAHETFVRVEVIDAEGRMAFTSPIKIV